MHHHHHHHHHRGKEYHPCRFQFSVIIMGVVIKRLALVWTLVLCTVSMFFDGIVRFVSSHTNPYF